MGLAAATFRLMYLNSFKHELENKITIVTESKLSLTKTISELTSASTDMDPESEVTKQLNQRKERLNALDKKLDDQMQLYNSQLEMVNTELQSCQKMQADSIKSSFSYGQQ